MLRRRPHTPTAYITAKWNEGEQRMRQNVKNIIRDYAKLTFATAIMAVAVRFFEYTNNFSLGGVTGLSILLAKFLPWATSSIGFVLNIALIVVGFLCLGRGFGVKTVYVSVLLSGSLALLENLVPMAGPMTDEPLLELVFAVALPALSSAILFDMEASSGGTDIIAMILKKYTSIDIGVALFCADLLITLSAFFVFGVKTGLLSFVGLLLKALVVDNVIESINLCKYFTVVCDDPEPICAFLHSELDRSATVCEAKGAYSGQKKYLVLSVMRRRQAVRLRNFIKHNAPDSFIMITNSSEIIGEGFRGFN